MCRADYSLLLGINRSSVPSSVPKLRRNSTTRPPNRRSVAAYPPGIELPESTPEDGVQLEEAAGNEEDLEAATVGSSWEEDPCCFKSVDGRKVHGDSALLLELTHG